MKPTDYLGRIQTKQQALSLAKKLDALGTEDAKGAASLIRNGWQRVAARPELVDRIYALLGEGRKFMEPYKSVFSKSLKEGAPSAFLTSGGEYKHVGPRFDSHDEFYNSIPDEYLDYGSVMNMIKISKSYFNNGGDFIEADIEKGKMILSYKRTDVLLHFSSNESKVYIDFINNQPFRIFDMEDYAKLHNAFESLDSVIKSVEG